MTANAQPKARGSRGLTLYSRLREASVPATAPLPLRAACQRQYDRQPLRQRQAQPVPPGASAEGMRKPKTTRALRDGVRHHAVQADGRQDERQRAENPDQRDGHHLRRRRAIELLLHGGHLVGRQIGIERVDFARDGHGHGLRSERRADIQHAAAKGILPQRDEEKWRRLLADAGILRVFGDARTTCIQRSPELEALAEAGLRSCQ